MKVYNRRYIHWNILRRKYKYTPVEEVNQLYMSVNIRTYPLTSNFMIRDKTLATIINMGIG